MLRIQPIRYGVKAIAPIIPDPILNIRCNDASGSVALDYSGNGYHGTYDGSHSKGVPLLGGNTGFQILARGGGISIAPQTQITNALRSLNYSVSIVFREMVNQDPNTKIFVVWNNSSSGIEVFQFYTNSFGGKGGGYDNGVTLFTTNDPSDTLTSQLLFVRSREISYLYCNGVLVASTTDDLVPAVTHDGSPYQIGGHINFPSSYNFIGKISDLIIWDTSLSASDAENLYAQNGRV